MKDLIIRIILSLMFVVAFALSSGAIVYVVWNGVVDLLVGVPHITYVHSIVVAMLFDLGTAILAFGIRPQRGMY
jgi:hypothetical protein